MSEIHGQPFHLLADAINNLNHAAQQKGLNPETTLYRFDIENTAKPYVIYAETKEFGLYKETSDVSQVQAALALSTRWMQGG